MILGFFIDESRAERIASRTRPFPGGRVTARAIRSESPYRVHAVAPSCVSPMGIDFLRLSDLPTRCADLDGKQVMRALRSPEAMRELLEHMANVAAPREGATKILVPLCQMGSKRCRWIDGALSIEIVDLEGSRTKILAGVDIGGGARELLFPKLVLEVPWQEFASAVEHAPRLVEPMTSRVKKRSILLAADAETIATVAPPSFAIAEDSWRRSLPPAVRLSLGPPLAMDAPFMGGENELLARARLGAPKAPAVAEDDLRELRALADVAELDDPGEAPRAPRISRAPTKVPPPKKKIAIRKRS